MCILSFFEHKKTARGRLDCATQIRGLCSLNVDNDTLERILSIYSKCQNAIYFFVHANSFAPGTGQVRGSSTLSDNDTLERVIAINVN